MTTSIANTIEAIRAFALTVGTTPLAYSFGVSDRLTELSRDKLPCALTFPVLSSPGRTSARTTMGGSVGAEFTVTQWVFFAPDSRPLHTVVPDMITYLDAFNTALIAMPFYTATSAPAAHNIPRPTWQIKVITYGGDGAGYWAIEFVYEVKLNL